MGRRATADVAVYAPFAGALYGPDGFSGGAETQSVFLARALAGAGLRVRHIVSGAEERIRDGVAVLSLGAGYAGGGPAARYRAILSALRRADAVVYVQRSAGAETGIVGAYARATRRRFVFSSSSDGDFVFDPEVSRTTGGSLDHLPTLLQYRLGLVLADRVVVQTSQQVPAAVRAGARNVRVVASFAEAQDRNAAVGSAFLWIGGMTEVKDPLAYVRLAASVPDARFRMVASERGWQWRGLAEAVEVAASRVPNLELLPSMPRADLLELYDDARAVVGTSLLEGFPNTFLEAWARGRPVLSLRVDPGGEIERRGSGIVAGGSEERLADAARLLWQHPEEAARRGEAGIEYVRATHDPTVVSPQWAAIIEDLLRGR